MRPLKITLLTFGTRGDIEPYLALAQGLKNSGHDPTLVAPKAYAEWIESHGVRAHPMRFDVGAFRWPAAGASGKPRNRFRQMLAFAAWVKTCNRESLEDYRAACEDADFIVQSGVAHGGVEIADSRGIPMAFSYLLPYAPTRAFPTYLSPLRMTLGGGYNRWTHRFAMRITWNSYGKGHNRWRATQFGLPPLSRLTDMLNSRQAIGAPNLYAYSRHVLPKPADWASTDHLTGYFYLEPDERWSPPAELVRFLDSGPAPIYVGFGSMPLPDPERRSREVVKALQMTGQRGILLTAGAGGLARIPAGETIFFADSVPYSWLFPRVAAVVHHGGAGTTAHALRSGAPNIIAPVILDQFAWADRLEELGVGVRAPRAKKLTAGTLADAIRRVVGDPSFKSRAAALGEKIRAEDGVARAVELIERHAGTTI